MNNNHEVWMVCMNCGKEYDGRRLVCDSCGCAVGVAVEACDHPACGTPPKNRRGVAKLRVNN